MVVPPRCYVCWIGGASPGSDCHLCEHVEFKDYSYNTNNQDRPGPVSEKGGGWFCDRHVGIAKRYTNLDFDLAEPLIMVDAYHLERGNKNYLGSANLAKWIYTNIHDQIILFAPIIKERFIQLDGEDSTSVEYWAANAIIDYALDADESLLKMFVKSLEEDGITLDSIKNYLDIRVNGIKDKSELKTILITLATIQENKN